MCLRKFHQLRVFGPLLDTEDFRILNVGSPRIQDPSPNPYVTPPSVGQKGACLPGRSPQEPVDTLTSSHRPRDRPVDSRVSYASGVRKKR